MSDIEYRDSDTKKETRSSGELRSVDEDGMFEGYLTVWDTVDDYNSTFKRGSFKKTIQERASKVKIYYDHEHLIGSSVELREDDHGVYGVGKLNLDVDKAKEAYSFMKDGTLDGLSFGFRTLKEGFKDGIRQIKEVQLFEFGPVTFPANDAAEIISVRSEDFSESLTDSKLREESWTLRNALDMTISDIWWSNDSTSENVIGKLDAALADYHASYLEYAARYVSAFWSKDDLRSSPFDNDLAKSVNQTLLEKRKTILELAGETSFTVDELQELRQGKLIENREKLETLSDEIKQAHKEQRNKAVEALCLELRDKLTNAETTRIMALLKPVEQRQSEPDTYSEMLGFFKEQTIGKEDA